VAVGEILQVGDHEAAGAVAGPDAGRCSPGRGDGGVQLLAKVVEQGRVVDRVGQPVREQAAVHAPAREGRVHEDGLGGGRRLVAAEGERHRPAVLLDLAGQDEAGRPVRRGLRR
jgi:hypothetical protein